ncbi:hypothetical protein Tco_0698538 [Tanacetum coccineum]
MAALKFADTHNMVAFLEKPTESAGFEEIVDFLNAHFIRYALTVNPTIYVSCIDQFWSTAKTKTINKETQIHALVDGKKIVITESFVRRDLQLADEEGEGLGQPTDPQHTPISDQPSITEQIIAQSSHQPKKTHKPRKPKSKVTQIPQSGEPIKFVADEATTTVSSLEVEQDSGSGPRRQDTLGDIIAQTRFENVSNTSNDSLLAGVNTPRSDEDSMQLKELVEFCTKLQQRVLNLENIKTTQAQEITSLKLRVKKLENKGGSRIYKLKRLYKVSRSARMVSSNEASLGDQEDASKQGRKIDDIDKDADIALVDETQGRYGDDLMFDTCVLDDEDVFAGHDMAEKDINVAKKEVSTAGEIVTTASVEVSTADDLTLDQTLTEIISARPKAKGIVFREPDESTTTTTRPQQQPIKEKRLQAQMQAELEEEDRLIRQREEEANIVSWDNMQAMIDADYQMAQQMQAEEQEKLSIKEKSKLFVQLLEARKKHFAVMRAKEKRNKPPTKAQKRNTMSTYLKNMAGYKHNQLKTKSFDDIQKLFDKAMKRVNTFIDMDTELVEGSEVRAEGSEKRAGEELMQESAKKQKVHNDIEEAELKDCLEIIPDEEEITIDVVPLAVKSPSIVDWKVVKDGKKNYYQIIRADGSSKMYLFFNKMLRNFNREDLETLYKFVKARYRSTRPVGEDRVLWGDLMTMFEPYVEDDIWRNQQEYRLLSWKLYDSCGVHCLMTNSMHIYMLVEKKYPLAPITLSKMWEKNLQVDYLCKMAYQLLRFIKSQLKKIVGIKSLLKMLEVNAAQFKVNAAQRN